MEIPSLPTTAAELGKSLGASVLGDESSPIRSLAPLSVAGEGSLAFLANRKYLAELERARGAVVIARSEMVRTDLPLTFLVVSDPQAAFAAVAQRLVPPYPWPGISPQASIASTAVLAEGVDVGPFAVIGPNVKVGPRTRIGAFAYLGPDVRVGADCEIQPRATLLDRVTLGDRVRVFPGAVVGGDGFGLFDYGSGRVEMPQIGTVVIEDDVRIGANSTVDRSTLCETRVGRGTKMDAHVHIGHNAKIGAGGILCAQVGIAGSAVVEEDVIFGGQAGVGHGCTIGKGARLGGQSGTSTNLAGGETYTLFPAVPIRDATRIVRYWKKLPEIWQRLRRLERAQGLGDLQERGEE